MIDAWLASAPNGDLGRHPQARLDTAPVGGGCCRCCRRRSRPGRGGGSGERRPGVASAAAARGRGPVRHRAFGWSNTRASVSGLAPPTIAQGADPPARRSAARALTAAGHDLPVWGTARGSCLAGGAAEKEHGSTGVVRRSGRRRSGRGMAPISGAVGEERKGWRPSRLPRGAVAIGVETQDDLHVAARRRRGERRPARAVEARLDVDAGQPPRRRVRTAWSPCSQYERPIVVVEDATRRRRR
jgi:hypothetical protein